MGVDRIPGLDIILSSPVRAEELEKTLTKDPKTGETITTSRTTRYVDNPKYQSPIIKAYRKLKSTFSEEETVSEGLSVIKESSNSTYDKTDAMALTKNLIKYLESTGELDRIRDVGNKILNYKQEAVKEKLNQAENTLKTASTIIATQSFDKFKSEIQKIPSRIDINLIESEIKRVASELKKEFPEDTESVLVDKAWNIAKSSIVKNYISSIDRVYENFRSYIMGGLTEKGLKLISSTKEGKEYANFVKHSMEILNNSIIELRNIETKLER